MLRTAAMVDGRATRVLVWGGIGAEGEKSEAVVRRGAFILRQTVPRHDVGRGGAASDKVKLATASWCPPCARMG
jgi:hypothetical protein